LAKGGTFPPLFFSNLPAACLPRKNSAAQAIEDILTSVAFIYFFVFFVLYVFWFLREH
jgi:hypothetical protein